MEKPKDPKKKAKQLAKKMFAHQWRQGVEHASDKEYRNACWSAIILVDEVLKIEKNDFWKDVKKHLRRLIDGTA